MVNSNFGPTQMFRVINASDIRATKFPIGDSLMMPGIDSLPVRANESFMIIKALLDKLQGAVTKLE